jgi:acyl-CoA thioester hydrolase
MSPAIFTQTVEVRWSDLDANQHMRHSAYADLCTQAQAGEFATGKAGLRQPAQPGVSA